MIAGAGATSRWWRGAGAFAVGVLVTSACSSSKSLPSALVPLQSALAGQPDATTQAAVMTLATALNAEDWGYLIYAQWPDDGGAAALTDPTLQKAANALLAAGTTTGAQAVGAAKGTAVQCDPAAGGGLHPLGNPVGETPENYQQWLANYPKAVQLMQNKNGLDFAATPAAAAAFAQLLASSLPNNTLLPTPTQPADGVLGGCGKSFYDGTTLGPNCSASDFCCKGQIDFPPPVGVVTCVDFTSCRGSSVIPTLTVQQTTSAGGSASGSNVCFPGGSLAGDPAQWNAACQTRNPQMPNAINCNAADPSLGIPAPTLSNGQDPAQVCTVFTDADGQGTTLGVVRGCDPSDYPSGGVVTCYCCP